MEHKSGFVNIIGKPNVGKSTLMNALIGQKLSIITPKAQTTRHRILGIANGDNYQIVFSDTPGIIKPSYKLQERMMDFVEEAFTDADILLFLIDVNDNSDYSDNELITKLKNVTVPLIVCINKIDQSDQQRIVHIVEHWKELLPNAAVFPIAALHMFNTENLKKFIIDLLPENPAYFPKDDLSDKNLRFFVSEIIREKILLNYQKEVPYSVEVVIDSYKETETLDRIMATIFVERETQKAIIIGKKGEALKKVGTQARKDIEQLVGKKVYLELYIKVKKNWRNNDQLLNQFGYRV